MTIEDTLTQADGQALAGRLRQITDRIEQLQLLIETLGDATTMASVAGTIVDKGTAVVGAQLGVILLRGDDKLTFLDVTGYTPDAVSSLPPVPLDLHLPATVAAAGEAVFLSSKGVLQERFPQKAKNIYIGDVEAVAAVPLLRDGEPFGVLLFAFDESRPFEREDRSFIQTMASQVAQALERVRLMTAQRTTEQRQSFLSQASALLASSLDYSDTLQQVARLAVPNMADWCAVDILTSARSVERLAVAHVDPAKVAWAQELYERYPVDLEAADGLPLVLRTGEPLLVPVITEEMIAAANPTEETLEILRRLGLSSFIIAPLTARGRTFGALTLVAAESRYHYDGDDLAFAQDLAERAALAIDNARLFRDAEQHAARASARAEATRAVVAARLDLGSIIETITRIAAEQVGDGVIVRLVSDDGEWFETVALHHPDPEKYQMLVDVVGSRRLSTTEGYSALVIASGERIYISAADLANQQQSPLPPEYRDYPERHGYHATLIVPLHVGTQIVGTLALFRDDDQGDYSSDDQTFVQDLADVAALAIDNAQLYQEAQEAVHLRETFLSMASHELKTPLTTIKALGQLLDRVAHREDIDRPRLERLIGQLRSQTERFEELVNDLLDVSRIQQRRLEPHPEALDLRELTAEVLDRFRESAERTPGHKLVLEAPEPVVGDWDPSRLDQVLTNLISNALKYSPEGGEVRVAVRRRGGTAELLVADEGIGISEEEHRSLFQPFSRTERARMQVEGTGLGLYITREIVVQHGGTIEVESRPGEGSRFHVRLPLAHLTGDGAAEPDGPQVAGR